MRCMACIMCMRITQQVLAHFLTRAAPVRACPRCGCRCIWYGPDDLGNNGVYLGMNVVTEASRGLTLAMTKVRRGAWMTHGSPGVDTFLHAARRCLASSIAGC